MPTHQVCSLNSMEVMTVTEKSKPAFRICFSTRFRNGNKSQLGRSVEIGAAWLLKEGDGYRLNFNVVPQNLNDGVVFLNPVPSQEQAHDVDMEQE